MDAAQRSPYGHKHFSRAAALFASHMDTARVDHLHHLHSHVHWVGLYLLCRLCSNCMTASSSMEQPQSSSAAGKAEAAAAPAASPSAGLSAPFAFVPPPLSSTSSAAASSGLAAAAGASKAVSVEDGEEEDEEEAAAAAAAEAEEAAYAALLASLSAEDKLAQGRKFLREQQLDKAVDMLAVALEELFVDKQ